jgi:cell wall assembly regulator SMI1
MGLNFEEKGRNLSEKALVAFEKKVGTQLPNDYRDFLRRVNGGILVKEMVFPIKGEESDSVIDGFYTLAKSSDEFETIADALETFVLEKRMPAWFLPVAADVFGNQICLSLAEADFGTVYFWNHEQEPETVTEQFDNVHLVSPSFREFLALLHPVEED